MGKGGRFIDELGSLMEVLTGAVGGGEPEASIGTDACGRDGI